MAYRNSVVNLALNPDDHVAAQAENAMMMDKLIEKAKTMDAEDWGELTGQIGFEVILEVATLGGAAALTTLKVADKTVDAARALEKLDDLAGTAKGLERIDDVGDGLKIADEVGDVFHYVDRAEDILDPPETYRDIHGRLKDSKTNRYVTIQCLKYLKL